MANELIISQDLLTQIRDIMSTARNNVAQQVNNELIVAYWNIGRVIVEHEQGNNARADYGKETLKLLSRTLTKEFGKGFSRSNLQNMRLLYLAYPKCQTLSGKLSWSHYCELLTMMNYKKYQESLANTPEHEAAVKHFG